MHSAPQALAQEGAHGAPWVCSRCGWQSIGNRPLGCSLCGRANTYHRAAAATAQAPHRGALSWVSADQADAERLERVSSGVAGWDRVTGGIVRGRTYMLGGARGIGKSTLALVVASGIAARHGRALVATLEQDDGVSSARRIMDEQRAALAGVNFTRAHELDELAAIVRELRPAVLVVDSWKMLTVRGTAARSGTLAELATMRALPALAAELEVAIVGILHMRTGDPKRYSAGAPVMQLCDALLRFDRTSGGARLLCDGKNRYADDHETAEFRREGSRLVEVPPCS